MDYEGLERRANDVLIRFEVIKLSR